MYYNLPSVEVVTVSETPFRITTAVTVKRYVFPVVIECVLSENVKVLVVELAVHVFHVTMTNHFFFLM